MSEIFRDRSEGAAARRQELLRRRREELATMPHAVRRVVVARSARIAASMMATLAGGALIVAAAAPSVAARMTSVMPGADPAPLTSLLAAAWVLGVVAWAISRARVEHRFAVAMSRHVLPSSDVDDDVERLDHERPDRSARAMGHRLEVRSAAWPIVAIAALLPATALWFAAVIESGSGWPVSAFEADAAAHAGLLIAIASVGALGAIVMTRRALRRPALAAMVFPAGILTSALMLAALVTPTATARLLVALGGLALAVGLMARRLRRERALLEIDDPAAGSEIFTIRGATRGARTALASVVAMLRRIQRKHLLVLAGIGVVMAGAGIGLKTRQEAAATRATPAAAPIARADAPAAASSAVAARHDDDDDDETGATATPTGAAASRHQVVRAGRHFKIVATLDQHGDATVPLPGIKLVPRGWVATLATQLVSAEPVFLVGDSGLAYLDASQPTVIHLNACDRARPLALLIHQPPLHGQRIVLEVNPSLTIADCTPAAIEMRSPGIIID